MLVGCTQLPSCLLNTSQAYQTGMLPAPCKRVSAPWASNGCLEARNVICTAHKLQDDNVTHCRTRSSNCTATTLCDAKVQMCTDTFPTCVCTLPQQPWPCPPWPRLTLWYTAAAPEAPARWRHTAKARPLQGTCSCRCRGAPTPPGRSRVEPGLWAVRCPRACRACRSSC